MLNEFLKENGISIIPVQEADQPFDMFGGEFVGQCSPVFRWVGGKSQLLSAIRFYAPKKFNSYFEPFIGGGALFFDLMPNRAFINDVNPVIITLYKDIRDHYLELISLVNALSKLDDCEETYFNVRDIFNYLVLNGKFGVETSGLFFYLNAKCFNGLYRVNSKGEFNVGYAKESRMKTLVGADRIHCLHDYFTVNAIEILCGDFLDCTKSAKEGDFVYFDPPYVPVSETKNFTGYSSGRFDSVDQDRLFKEFKRLSDLGVKCIMSNSDCEYIYDTYADYTIKKLNVNYYIQPNSDDLYRTECLILNF